jgi:small GTP-binding protein
MKCHVCLIGPQFAGKTSLFKRFTTNRYETEASVGIDFGTTSVELRSESEGNLTVYMYVWDTIGLDRHKMITETYIATSDVILVVFDINDPLSASNALHSWLPFAERVLTERDIDLNRIIIIGTKADSGVCARFVALDVCIERGYSYFECNSKEDEGANNVLTQIARRYVRACEL